MTTDETGSELSTPRTDALGFLVVERVKKKIEALEDLHAQSGGSKRSGLEAGIHALTTYQTNRSVYRSMSLALTDLVDAVARQRDASTPTQRDEALALVEEAFTRALPLRVALDHDERGPKR